MQQYLKLWIILKASYKDLVYHPFSTLKKSVSKEMGRYANKLVKNKLKIS